MKFKKNTRRPVIEYEKDLVRYWQDNKVFEKSIENRPKDDTYVFYDGPPFITGVPHHGTLLSSIVKDAVPRYWTMKGKRVERVWGWDCHGLPAEVYTEKKLGITDKKEIGTKISLEDYIKACRENMVQTGNEWEDTIVRVGRWVNFKGAYKTMDKEYMESVWWAFKQLYDKGKIYEGEKVLLYCTRDATPLSKAEVAMDNSYQDITDPSVYVKFKLKDEDSYLLAWTTTPWTLNTNAAVAVNKNITYAEVEVDGQHFILAKALVDKALTDEKHRVLPHKLLRTFKGKELIGRSYEPLFINRGKNAHKIWHADFVHDEEGTGVAHESPAYGEDDYNLAKQHNIPVVIDTDEEGVYTEGDWRGEQVWDINKQIAKELHQKGMVWKIEYIRHSYPHCHRCGTKLMYRAHPSWFMDVGGQRQEMLADNKNINWFPEHIKHGRFEKTVETAPDWNLSRDRFWATAMPVWKGMDKDGKEHIKVVGSYKELKELSGKELDDYHRPWIDEVIFTIDGIEYKRVDKVMDSWFEAGSMPFAQFHYPFENAEQFEANFPGDFISEYVAQVRAWFYYLHTVSMGLFGKNAFKNVVVTGTLLGDDGRKLSKSLNNFTDPNLLMDQYGADSLRFLLLSSPALAGEDFVVIDKDVADVSRKLAMVWNMFDFFTLYAEVDGWEWEGKLDDPTNVLKNPLDIWVVSRIHQLTKEVEVSMDRYDIPDSLKPVLPFIDDASNWYVRRSRRRFWKGEDDKDKHDAYKTLHYVLVRLSMVLAPFTPFLAEELYRKLTGGESVHLLDWPQSGEVDEASLVRMEEVRRTITEGLALRAAAGIKVRQPLGTVVLENPAPALLSQLEREKNAGFYHDLITEELNVKKIKTQLNGPSGLNNLKVMLDTEITPELREEGIMRELVRVIQNARKDAGLNVEDRISLLIDTESPEIQQAINTHQDVILAETLTEEYGDVPTDAYQLTAKVEGLEIRIALAKY